MLHQGKDKTDTGSGGNGNQGNGSPLRLHETAHDGQPQAQAAGPRRPETLKNGFRPFDVYKRQTLGSDTMTG